MPFQVQSSAPDPQASVARVAPIDWLGAVKRGIDMKNEQDTQDMAMKEAVQRLEFNAEMDPIKIALRKEELEMRRAERPAREAKARLDVLEYGVKLELLAGKNAEWQRRKAFAAAQAETLKTEREVQDQENATADAVLTRRIQDEYLLPMAQLMQRADEASHTQAAELFTLAEAAAGGFRTPQATEAFGEALAALDKQKQIVQYSGYPVEMSRLSYIRGLAAGVPRDQLGASQEQRQSAIAHMQEKVALYGADNWQEMVKVEQAIQRARTQTNQLRAAGIEERAETEEATFADQAAAAAIAARNSLAIQERIEALLGSGSQEEVVARLRELSAMRKACVEELSDARRLVVSQEQARREGLAIPPTLGGRPLDHVTWGLPVDADVQLKKYAEVQSAIKRMTEIAGSPELSRELGLTTQQAYAIRAHLRTKLPQYPGSRLHSMTIGLPARAVVGVTRTIAGADTKRAMADKSAAALADIYDDPKIPPAVRDALTGAQTMHIQERMQWTRDRLAAIDAGIAGYLPSVATPENMSRQQDTMPDVLSR